MAANQIKVPAVKPLNIAPLEQQERFKTKFTKSTKAGGGLIADHDTGTGKTMTSIIAANETGRPLVAIVPAALRANYRKELKASGYEGDATVISYQEALNMSKDPEFKKKVKQSVVVYDEAHRMGRSESEASKLPQKLKSHKNLLLTGTLIRNHPTEMIPLLRAVMSDKSLNSTKAFKEEFLQEEEIRPGLLGRLKGAKPGMKETPKNADKFRKMVSAAIDSHRRTEEHMPGVTEEDVNIPMSSAQGRAYDAITKGNPGLAYKLRNGIPPGKSDFAKYRAFLTGLRQVSNTPDEFATKTTAKDAPKITAAADTVAKHIAENPKYRGYSYSNYIKSGLLPMQAELKARGIKSEIFDGKMNDKERKALVEKYNKGKVQHLLISSAGGEGLDLKGTRLIQILEPHWNNAKIHQVTARGIRYKSHAHLPKEDRNVHVQRYFSEKPQHPIHKFLRMKKERSADQAVHEIAAQKDKLNTAFLSALDSKQ